MDIVTVATKDFFVESVATASHFIILKTNGIKRKGLLFYGLLRAIQPDS